MSTGELVLPPELIADPADRRVADAFVRRALWRYPNEAAVRLRELISDPGAPFQVALAEQVARLEGAEPVREILAERRDHPVPDVSATVDGLLGGIEVEASQRAGLVGLSPAQRDLAAVVWDRTRYLPIEQAPGGVAERFLASPALGPTPSVLTEGMTFTDPELRRLRLEGERLAGYQSHVLRTGRLAINDPTTGAPARYLGYIRHFDKYIYRLRGHVDFLLVASRPSGRIGALYLPGENTLLTIDPQDGMLLFALSTWPGLKVTTALALARRGTPRRNVRTPHRARVRARVGGPPNFAHVMWNCLGGLERERILGNLERLTDVVSIGSEFFGPVPSLFPELTAAHIEHRASAGSELTFVADPSAIEVPIGTSLLLPGALERIRSAAHERQSTTARGLLRRLKPYRRRLYIALRVDNKAWVDVRTQLPALIDHATSTYPDLAVVIDGFAVPSGTDYVTSRWTGQIEELHELVADITARLARPERVVSLVGRDMLTSLAVVETATAYLCPVGTAHHKIDWLYDVPGVVYASAEYAEYAERFENWAGMQQRVNSHVPVPVVGRNEAADTSRRFSAGDQRRDLRNLELTWQEAWAALEPLLAGQPAPSGRVRTALRKLTRRG